jgi:hypothetical protein
MNLSDSAVFCTAFDQRYLSRGLVMVESIKPHLIFDQKIVILALDFESFSFLKNRYANENSVEVVSVQDFPEVDFWAIRSTRSYKEFCWALGSVVSNVLLLNENKMTVYVDADTCFFSSPQSLLTLCSNANASITPHRFPKRLQSLEVNGKYNVGWVSFTPTPVGIAISKSWRKECEESTAYNAQEGVVGDQKYLDKWVDNYSGVLVLNDPGVNAAPWNHEAHSIFQKDGLWFVDEVPLVFYHFHGFLTLPDGVVSPVSALYRMAKDIPSHLYSRYYSLLQLAEQEIGLWANVPIAKSMKLKGASRLNGLVSLIIRSVKRLFR